MWFKVKSFILFLFKSTNQHGVHSPFVFNLVTNCFYKKATFNNVNLFKSIRKWLINNNTVINVTDFGKGSKVFKSNTRKVKDITKIAGISTKKGLLLLRLVNYLKPQNILEIGTSVGLSAAMLSIGNPSSKIKTLEGCNSTAAIAQELFDEFKLKNIEVVKGNFNKTLPKVLNNSNFDFIYFDGNHQKEATINYFNLCLSAVNNDSVFIFDDINWSSEMQEAWLIIKDHSKVTVSIDTFFWGIIFFRKEQEKEHFTIRI
jgi:predicted O-methyltransferase YrrM